MSDEQPGLQCIQTGAIGLPLFTALKDRAARCARAPTIPVSFPYPSTPTPIAPHDIDARAAPENKTMDQAIRAVVPRRIDPSLSMIQIKAVAGMPRKTGAWQSGFPPPNWSRLRLSFSAWLFSPSSGSPFGQNHEGRGAPRLSPRLLALAPDRIARRVLRLDPHLAWPAAVRRIRPL